MKQKYYLALSAQDNRLMIESLNQLRNKLIADGKYTDAIDEVLLKEIQSNFQGGVIMEKYIFDERNGLWYELQGVYYLPCLRLPEEEQQSIGIWGQRHLRYIKQHRKLFYTKLLTSGKLNGYLADIDGQAKECFESLTEQMKGAQSITEQLKAENALEWVGRMNNIRVCVMEIVNNEIFYI